MQSGATFQVLERDQLPSAGAFGTGIVRRLFLSKLLAHKYTVNIVVTAEDGQKIGML